MLMLERAEVVDRLIVDFARSVQTHGDGALARTAAE